MILLDILRLILVFPFLILLVLKVLGLGDKQAHFIVAPFYLYSMVVLSMFVLEPVKALLAMALYLFILLVRSMQITKKEYNTVFISRLIRKFVFIFSKTYLIYYSIFIILGIIFY